jgi:hypothetical protein
MTAPTALPATAHGWQRMPDLDLPCATAWELPNGCVCFVPAGTVPTIERDGERTIIGTRVEGAKP